VYDRDQIHPTKPIAYYSKYSEICNKNSPEQTKNQTGAQMGRRGGNEIEKAKNGFSAEFAEFWSSDAPDLIPAP